jgi:murein DD-endopeptidase MepM/ murein hydrolase activator NlpD
VELKVEEPRLETVAETQSYTVQPGDTIATIAEKLGVALRSLIEENRLLPPYALVEGQTLLCPQSCPKKPAREGEEVSGAAPEPGWHSDVQVAPLEPAWAEEAEPLATPKEAPVEKTLGERLKEAHLSEPPPPAPVPRKKGPPPDLPQKGETIKLEAKAKKPAPAEAEDLEEPEKPEKAAPVPASHASLAWPIKGKILASFGSGESADGVEISGKAGDSVLSAEDGLVVYAGAKLKSFGNLVLVKHENGLMTAYAHLGKIAVSKGDYVDRGQKIGTVGKTGDVSEPQLYFEVRKNKKPVDPLRFLPK